MHIFRTYLLALLKQDYVETERIKQEVGIDFWNQFIVFLKQQDNILALEYNRYITKQEQINYDDLSPSLKFE